MGRSGILVVVLAAGIAAGCLVQIAGPGVLVEVEEDDGEQVLVWLR